MTVADNCGIWAFPSIADVCTGGGLGGEIPWTLLLSWVSPLVHDFWSCVKDSRGPFPPANEVLGQTRRPRFCTFPCKQTLSRTQQVGLLVLRSHVGEILRQGEICNAYHLRHMSRGGEISVCLVWPGRSVASDFGHRCCVFGCIGGAVLRLRRRIGLRLQSLLVSPLDTD